MKKLLTISLILLTCAVQAAGSKKDRPLNDPVLEGIDGVSGLMDANKIKNSIWMIKEIKKIHGGSIRVNAAGKGDPRSNTLKEVMFQGKKQDLKSLIDIEKHVDQLSAQDKAALNALFHELKDYFGMVNDIMLADARGTFKFMVKLIKEFCYKRNRIDSLLMNWEENHETELYRKQVNSFRGLYSFTTDLMNFLADMIVSCPKAKAAYEATLKHGSAHART